MPIFRCLLAIVWGSLGHLPISLLVGEMPGRAEGGDAGRGAPNLSPPKPLPPSRPRSPRACAPRRNRPCRSRAPAPCRW
ncbi:hypothetical protein B5K03_04870 [Rhizobium phaseoli]|nr:hypothetical protein B5K03_04870 [Rhizobium phaseoli]